MQQPSESQEQIAVVSRCKLEGIFIFSIPNGANLSGSKQRFAEIAKLKAEGLTPGVPDIFVPELFLFIEMKRRDRGTLSQKQKDIHKILRGFGYEVEVCHGAEAAWHEIERRYKAWKQQNCNLLQIVYTSLKKLRQSLISTKNK